MWRHVEPVEQSDCTSVAAEPPAAGTAAVASSDDERRDGSPRSSIAAHDTTALPAPRFEVTAAGFPAGVRARSPARGLSAAVAAPPPIPTPGCRRARRP